MQKIKAGEQQIVELTENVQRLKGQIQDLEKQLSKLRQTEAKLKEECEQLRGQLTETQRSQSTLQTDLANLQRTVSDDDDDNCLSFIDSSLQNRQFCVDIWRCFSSDDEYDDDEQTIIEQIRQLQRQLEHTQSECRHEQSSHASTNEHVRLTCQQLVEILVSDQHSPKDRSIEFSSRLSEQRHARTNLDRDSSTCSRTDRISDR